MGGLTVPSLAELNQRIGWQSPVTADDGAGNVTVTGYAAAVDRWAKVTAAPRSEQTIAGALSPVAGVRIEMRASADPGIRSTWRGLWRRVAGDLTLQVVAVAPATPAIGWVTVEAVIVGDPA